MLLLTFIEVNRMRYTDEQQKAIDKRGASLLLSAAAGSGKTATLVERIMRLVEDGADVDSMLVVTFTRAAAAGMREKLSRALSEQAAAGNQHAHEQLIRLERALITTLHAFCADFLRENFESADVDPAFTILDDADEKIMLDAALDEALEKAYENGGEALGYLDYGRGPSGVREMAIQLVRFLESRPDPDAWLEKALSGIPSDWIREVMQANRHKIEEAYIHILQALAFESELPPHYSKALSEDVAGLEDLLLIEDYEQLRIAVENFKFTTPRGRNTGYSEDVIKQVKDLRDTARKRLGDLSMKGLPLAVAVPDAEKTLMGAKALGGIVRDVMRLMDEAKAERGALTYGDLEGRTLRALYKEDVSRAMKERFSYVFVDEYQDTSDIQEAIVSRIAREDNLFMVGDVKQSIYRFRQAEPSLFLDKYARYSKGEGGVLLPLTRNFRSERSVLDFTNAVFEKLMTGGDSEILYDEAARLRPGSDDAPAGPPVEVHVLTGSADDELTSGEREGLLIAKRIKEMMAEDETLRYRDFAILTRQGARAFDALMPMLISEGIPCYADGAAGYFDTLEIRLMLSLVKITDNLHSDIELIGILRSCVCLLSVEELAQVRLCDREGSFADAVLKCAEGDGELAEKLREFLSMLDSWRLQVGAVGLDKLMRIMADESGLYAYVGALPGGAQRQANIDQFIMRAGNYDRDVSGSLNRFLAFAEGLKAKGAGDAAHVLGENDDVVRLMTVHHSKGLEFRVVFGALMGTRLRMEKNDDSMLCHSRLGIGLMHFDEKLRSRRNTISRVAIMDRMNREGLAEELRVMYVLFTRAQERLLLVGTVKDIEKAHSLWRAAFRYPMLTGTMLNMTMAALGDTAQHSYMTFHEHEASDYAPPGIAAGRVQVRIDPEDYDPALAAKYMWQYPDSGAESRPLKLTASGLMRSVEGPENMEPLAPRPNFMSGRGMTGAETGTAYHRAMRFIDLTALDGLEGRPLIDNIRLQLDSMHRRELLTREEREAVRPTVLAQFMMSDTGLRLRKAEAVRRELPFNVPARASQALTGEEMRGSDGDMLVQGTIDCCFMEDGQWVLLDYKTNRTDDLEGVKNHYARQLELYAYALKKITGIPVKDKILCLIAMGTEFNY